jgi:hypothetical protein
MDTHLLTASLLSSNDRQIPRTFAGRFGDNRRWEAAPDPRFPKPLMEHDEKDEYPRDVAQVDREKAR